VPQAKTSFATKQPDIYCRWLMT